MRDHAYVDKAKLSPARIFKSPMNVVEANDIGPAEKLAILQAWEADERALLRAEDEGMGGGEHVRCKRLSTISSNELAGRVQRDSPSFIASGRSHEPERSSAPQTRC